MLGLFLIVLLTKKQGDKKLKSSREIYKKRNNVYEKLLSKQTKASNRFSNLRLLTIVIGVAISIFLYVTQNHILLAGSVIVTLVLFIYLVSNHEKLAQNKEYTKLLSNINRDSMKRCNGEWNQFPEDGKEFIDENHFYSYDLDIFGENSLFQWINTTQTFIGRHKLKTFLTQHSTSIENIIKRQDAIDELAIKLSWRQRFQAEGLIKADKMHNPEDLVEWVNKEKPFFRKPCVIFSIRLLPVITSLLLLLSWLTGKIPYYAPATGLIIQLLLLIIKNKDRKVVFKLAEKYKKDISIYYNMIKQFEKQKFYTDYLRQLKNSMEGATNKPAYKQVDKLFKIVESLNNRENLYYFFFNLLTLSDYRYLIILEKWKKESGPFLKNWIEAVGDVEALASLAILRYDYPKWATPEIISTKNCVYEAKDMGHPLLTDKRIDNHLEILEPVHTLLITGSNMSGKSTFLRAAGINLVLAYAGAPVCAKFFRASLMQIHTCMRVSDNLGKNISSFYAELLRIKTIVQAAEEGENVFYLLDEIFKGTNSKDRHMGAKVLIKNLSATQSIGMVSTHDLELCDIEEKNPAVKNYHFREYYRDNKIYFDYKLRPGASTTRNAIYLMKLAGIDVEKE